LALMVRSAGAVAPSDVMADMNSPRPTGQQTAPPQTDLAGGGVYDLSPAAARAALAHAEYDRASGALIGTTAHLRAEFFASKDYLSAVKAVNDSQAAYDAAVAPVLDAVHREPAYRSAIERRNAANWEMKMVDSEPIVYALAERKMQFGAEATRLESSALNGDPAIRQAKARLAEAQQALADKQSQFEASLYSNPSIVQAKQAYDAARANVAAADAALHAAVVARRDTIAADRRRYPDQSSYNYNPYGSGYYGLGNGYWGWGWGPAITIIRGDHDHDHDHDHVH